jgi:hypothetical protein
MRVRSITTCALGLTAVLSAVNALAAQQDTTRLRRTTSDQRIMVSKGEVASPLVRVDTVYVTRYDTVRATLTRVDTVTVALAEPQVIPKIRGPMFWGVYAGTTDPWGNIDRVYTKGFHAGGVLGWESQNSPIGLRFDGAMSQFGREQGIPATNAGTGTPLMLHLAADLKAKALMLKGWSLYGIGGLNYNRYKRIALAAEGSTVGQNNCDFQVRGACYENANDRQWSDKFGYNFGLGTDFHIGSQDMFLEARYMVIPANGARSWTLPISLGVRYF